MFTVYGQGYDGTGWPLCVELYESKSWDSAICWAKGLAMSESGRRRFDYLTVRDERGDNIAWVNPGGKVIQVEREAQ